MSTQKVVYDISVKDGVSSAIDKLQQKTSGLKSAFMSLAPALGVGAIVAGITKVVNVNKDFEKSVSTLSSLTGKQGEELDFLRQKAKEMGSTTTLSATQAADAMTLIGSRFPDLLKSSKGLAAVTNEAAILAEAAGIDMPTAAMALTSALNQFDLSADKSRMVIDTLAAGSQAGTADINYLNEAIDKSGAIAKSAGLNFQETVSAIETIAGKIPQASTAGLQLKNVFLELANGADKYNPKIVGMETALDNLAKDGYGDATKASDKFNGENAIAAATLIANRDKFKEYTQAVSVSGKALEQQAINNDNLDGSLKSLGSAVEGLSITLGSMLDPIIRTTVQGLTSLAFFITNNIDVIGMLGAALLTGVVAFKAYNAVLFLSRISTVIAAGKIGLLTGATLAQKVAATLLALATGKLKIAQVGLNLAMSVNPVGLIIAGFVAFAAAIAIAWEKSETFRGVILGIWEVIKLVGETIWNWLTPAIESVSKAFSTITSSIAAEFAEFGKLFDIVASWFMEKIGKPIADFFGSISKLIDFDIFGGSDEDSFASKISKAFAKGVEDGKDKVESDEGIAVPIGDKKNIDVVTATNDAVSLAKKLKLEADAEKKLGGVTPSATGTVSGDVSGVQGSKLTNINITINKLVEELNINTTTLKEGAGQIREEISKALLTAVNDTNIIAG